MASVRLFALAALLAASAATPLLAQEAPMAMSPFAGVIDEVRVGIQAHDVDYAALPFRFKDYDLSRIEDVSFDVLFTSPDIEAFRWVGAPRPELGTTISLGGRDSIAHLGLTWQLPLFETPLYLEASFGAAANNGYTTNAPQGRKNFGCQVNFYQRYGVGANLGENFTATLTYEHTSNAELCDANEGLSNFGIRVGYKF